jgi:ubiquinone/menaquinone biosynthesis C-methylase UbiE
VLAVAGVQPGDAVVDLGAGNGQLSLPLAEHGARVLGVDVSPGMVSALRSEALRRGLPMLEAITMPIEELDLPAGSVDLVVSSYALHHLRDPDKAKLVQAAARWLRPGGRIVIADMMFGRGGSQRDREIIKLKLLTLARKGPGGWWRITKNVVRYLVRVQECPISMDAWTALLRAAGFASITASGIVAEAGLVSAQLAASELVAANTGAQLRPRPNERRLVRPWGAAVLAAAGLAGILLAVHGATSGGTARPVPSAGARGSGGASGPLLSSQPFASYTYRIWPGQRSSAARAALAGLAVTVQPQGPGLSVVAGVNGQPRSARYYPGGARVYVVEAAPGDDSGSTDYSLGDDGVVVTDAQGRIVS